MSENNKRSDGSVQNDDNRESADREPLQSDLEGLGDTPEASRPDRYGDSNSNFDANSNPEPGADSSTERQPGAEASRDDSRNESAKDGSEQGATHQAEPAASSASGGSDDAGRLRDALLRTRAEMDNLHKRAERELEKSRKFAVEGLLKDLVPIIDSLDQGIEASGESGAEGLKLTRKLALDTLRRYGLEVVDPDGEAFDPQWHEAMSMIESEDHASGQVMTVLQRGYRLHDRVVRAARVIVAK